MKKLAEVRDFKEVLKKEFTDKNGEEIKSTDSRPAYLHLTGPVSSYTDLLDRYVTYLKKNKNTPISERQLINLAMRHQYPRDLIELILAELRDHTLIGFDDWGHNDKTYVYSGNA